MPRDCRAQVTFERGWAALCFSGDTNCIAAMEKTAARASRYVRSEFVLESTLLGQPGATQRFAALIVPPSAARTICLPRASQKISAPFAAAPRERIRGPV